MVLQGMEELTQRWQAVAARDASAAGRFWYGVVTTGIYCRPQCPSRPKRQNVIFFDAWQDAQAAGFRPCKRCRPDKEHEHGKP